MTGAPSPAPRLRGIGWRLAWVSAVGGVLLATVLAVVGTGVAGGGTGLFAQLIPAIVVIGIGMAVPPVLGAVLGLAIVSRPPRTRRREQWAVAIGGAVGGLVSPVLFYTGIGQLGVAIALVVVLAVGAGYPLILRSLWRRAAASG